MRFQALAFAASAASIAMTAPQALAVQISGDERYDVVTSHTPEIEANILMNAGCEIQFWYEWDRDPSRPIMIEGSNDRRRSEAYRGGDLDLVHAPASGGYNAKLSFGYRDTVGEDGVHRQVYEAYLVLAQVGPFSVGQTFSLSPDKDNPGAATATLSVTLTADDLEAATASGNERFDSYQAQCGQ